MKFKILNWFLATAMVSTAIYACKDKEKPDVITYQAVKAKFAGKIDPYALANYAAQTIPSYITLDNSGANKITDAGATLGRVLFYDKSLSVDNTVACASCHKQAEGFSDGSSISTGVNGTTERHSMRLINARFGENVFFWDKRAKSLEEQTTQPIQDHIEMGYSGQNGDPTMADLITKLNKLEYLTELFYLTYGSEEITEDKIQKALAQFIRSIQSFDSKYDVGRAAAANEAVDFANFTVAENLGKTLFNTPPIFNATGLRTGGGAGCGGCHKAPTFSIDPNSKSNGIVNKVGGGQDFTNFRAPTLRDLMNADGLVHGPLMHNASFGAVQGVIAHYNAIPAATTNIDPRLTPGGNPQKLNLSSIEKANLFTFIKTLTGSNVYTDPKWSDPF